MTIQNLFQLRVSTHVRNAIDAYYQRFVSRQAALNVFTFTEADYMGQADNPRYAGSADFSGEVASITRMNPDKNGQYFQGQIYLFIFTDGTIVRVLGTDEETTYLVV